MARLGRAALAVLAGAAAWALPWIAGTRGAQAAFPEHLSPDQPITHVGTLVGLIAYSVVLSVIAGFVTASIARQNALRTVWVLAWIQLALGLVAEVSYWNLMPAWYHISFLALLVPATVYGGRLRTRGSRSMAGA